MLVTCEQCGKSYKVNDSRIPAQGARIKCPTCQHIFMVRPNADSGVSFKAPEPVATVKSSQENKAVTKEEVTWRVQCAGLPYTFHDLDALHTWMLNRASLDNIKVAKNEDDWKLLGDYPEVMTTELITKFFPLGNVPKTAEDGTQEDSNVYSQANPISVAQNMSTPKVSMNFGVAVASKSTIQNVAKSRKTKEKEERQAAANKGQTVKVLLAALFMIACLGMVLYVFGVFDSFLDATGPAPAGYHYEVDLQGNKTLVADAPEPAPTTEPNINLDLDPPAPAQPQEGDMDFGNTSPEDTEIISEEEAAAIVEAETKRILALAQESIKKKNWPVAQSTLLSFTKSNPDNKEAKVMLLKVYRAMGKRAEAEQLEAEIKAMKK